MLTQSKKISRTEQKASGKATMTPRQARYVRIQILTSLGKGEYQKTEDLKEDIQRHANFYHANIDHSNSKFVKPLAKSTFYDFMKLYNIPTPNQAKKMNLAQLIQDAEIPCDSESQTLTTQSESEGFETQYVKNSPVVEFHNQSTQESSSQQQYAQAAGSYDQFYNCTVEITYEESQPEQIYIGEADIKLAYPEQVQIEQTQEEIDLPEVRLVKQASSAYEFLSKMGSELESEYESTHRSSEFMSQLEENNWTENHSSESFNFEACFKSRADELGEAPIAEDPDEYLDSDKKMFKKFAPSNDYLFVSFQQMYYSH